MSLMMIIIMLLTLSVEKYTDGTSIDKLLVRKWKHSLSNHVNDRQYQKFCSNNNNNNNNNKTLICQSTPVKLMHFENLKILYAHGLWLTSYMKGRNKLTWNCWSTLAPGEMQLTYMAYTGISGAGKGIVFDLAVLNRVYNFVRVC